MNIAQTVLAEFDQEMKTTRRLLERVPEEHATWKPHEKSYSLGDLASHVANLPVWAAGTMQLTELDLGGPSAMEWAPRKFDTTANIVEHFDKRVAQARAAIEPAQDADFEVPWTLRSGEHKIFTMPRSAALRFFVVNHLIHHRGQLSVYLRLKDVPLPSIYGPTADAR